MEKKTMGAFIAALRKAKGMTQQEVADRLNVSNKAVSRWERDECAPDLFLIPAIAEMLGVTCDELLKGERIFVSPEGEKEKSEPKVEKQLKALISRSVLDFITFIWISLALSLVGFVCMLGVSYGFEAPIIGFALMMLFEAAALLIAAIGVNKMKEAKRDNELFDSADISAVNRYDKTLGIFSYAAYFAIFSVIALSFPFLFFTDMHGVLAFESYLGFFCAIASALVFIFLSLKDIYCAWITEKPIKNVININPRLIKMDVFQLLSVALACALFLIQPYFEIKIWINNVFAFGKLACFAADIVLFIVYISKYKSDKKALVLPGVRNLFLIFPALILQKADFAYYVYVGESAIEGAGETVNPHLERVVAWDPIYIRLAVILALLIFAIFRLLRPMIYKKD